MWDLEFVNYYGQGLLRLVAAMICGGLLGWERERHSRPAGLRTHMLVALGSAAFTYLSLVIAEQSDDPAGAPDPLRAVQGVIGGIGFLGAGSIIQAHGSVKGITTAATIWVVGALGVACGVGFFGLALLTTALAFFTLSVVGQIERRWIRAVSTARKESVEEV